MKKIRRFSHWFLCLILLLPSVATADPSTVVDQVREWRVSHEQEIVEDFAGARDN